MTTTLTRCICAEALSRQDAGTRVAMGFIIELCSVAHLFWPVQVERAPRAASTVRGLRAQQPSARRRAAVSSVVAAVAVAALRRAGRSRESGASRRRRQRGVPVRLVSLRTHSLTRHTGGNRGPGPRFQAIECPREDVYRGVPEMNVFSSVSAASGRVSGTCEGGWERGKEK